MATQTEPYAILFPDWYDERAQFETPHKGFLGGVVVRLEDGMVCAHGSNKRKTAGKRTPDQRNRNPMPHFSVPDADCS